MVTATLEQRSGVGSSLARQKSTRETAEELIPCNNYGCTTSLPAGKMVVYGIGHYCPKCYHDSVMED